ncbi:MAG: CpXC domain-containing protein [Pseudomonadota bacterium]
MSLFVPMHIACPHCDATVTMDAVGSVNADRRGDLRDAILNDTFQIVTCHACGGAFRLVPNFNYLDVGNRLWIAALPPDKLPEHATEIAMATQTFAESYGARAPSGAREVGETLDVRVTFGWQAVREKLLARVNGIDDVDLELLKLLMLRSAPGATLGEGIEGRLVDVGEDSLTIAWIDRRTEGAKSMQSVDRGMLEQVKMLDGPWADLRATLADGLFVDVQKLYLLDDMAA